LRGLVQGRVKVAALIKGVCQELSVFGEFLNMDRSVSEHFGNAQQRGFVYRLLDPGRLTEVALVVGSPSAFFTVIPGIFYDLTNAIKLLSDHDLAQMVLLMTVFAALAFVVILAHICPP
jgi:hypothetical protein